MLSSRPASSDTLDAANNSVGALGLKVSKTSIEGEAAAAAAGDKGEMFNSLQSLVDLANSDRESSSDASSRANNTNSSTPSDLVREANEKIRFSIHFDARKNQQQNSRDSANKILNVKEDLHKVKQDISELKNDLKSAEQPLMDILNYLDSPGTSKIAKEDYSLQIPSGSCIQGSQTQQPLQPPQHNCVQLQQSPEPPTRHNYLMETQNELQKLTQTMTAFQPVPPPRQVSA